LAHSSKFYHLTWMAFSNNNLKRIAWTISNKQKLIIGIIWLALMAHSITKEVWIS